jgi:hypothetical protein
VECIGARETGEPAADDDDVAALVVVLDDPCSPVPQSR